MMSRKLFAVVIAVMLCIGASRVAAANLSLSYTGVGFQVGLVVPDDVDMYDVDHYYRDLPGWAHDDVDIGLHLAFQGDIGFALGRAGELHYWPSGGLWFGGEHYGDYDIFAMEVLLNIFDVYYQFPVPLIVKPYVGLGPMISVMIGHWEHNVLGGYDESGSDPALGFNMFAGAHFDVSSSLRLFAEIRGKFSRWDLFRFTGGMTFGVGRNR